MRYKKPSTESAPTTQHPQTPNEKTEFSWKAATPFNSICCGVSPACSTGAQLPDGVFTWRFEATCLEK
jgi:hypothetical protein